MSRILILSDDPDEAVQWLTDEDVIRMPIEIAQVLLTVWSKFPDAAKKGVITTLVMYPEHVWIPWVEESQENYIALWNYGMDILDEHEYRFGKRAVNPYRHGMSKTLDRLQVIPPLPEGPQTPYPILPHQAVLMQAELVKVHYSHRDKPTWKK